RSLKEVSTNDPVKSISPCTFLIRILRSVSRPDFVHGGYPAKSLKNHYQNCMCFCSLDLLLRRPLNFPDINNNLCHTIQGLILLPGLFFPARVFLYGAGIPKSTPRLIYYTDDADIY